MSTIAQTLYSWQQLGVRVPMAAHPVVRWRASTALPAIARTEARPIVASAPQVVAAKTITPNIIAQNTSAPDLSQCNTLAQLAAAVQAFNGCALKQTARNTVFIDGCAQAPLLIIGEAPGQDEDQQGKPFVGRAGQLLNSMLQAIDYSRTHAQATQSVLIANSVFWRPPANRKPTTAEIMHCAPFVWRLIDIVRPQLVLALGGTAASLLLASDNGIMALRGQMHMLQRPHGRVPCLPMLHPAYLLRVPAAKKTAWHDMLQAKVFLTTRGASA